jgi:hypothetical protein
MQAGSIDIEIAWDGARISAVALANTRPAAARLLAGRSPQEALALAPRLFSLCRHGQTTAAWLALGAAEGRAPSDLSRADTALAAEAAQEHLWRLLLDWPALLGWEASLDQFAAWHRRLGGTAQSGDWSDCGGEFAGFIESEILGLDPAEWLACPESWAKHGRLAALIHELRELEAAGGTPATLLPEGRPALEYHRELASALNQDFARQPIWQGHPAETGPLARWQEAAPVAAARAAGWPDAAARLLARGVDLAYCALEAQGRTSPRKRSDACAPEPGLGLAWTETSRGVLLHQARVAEGRVIDYLIVAPTEWNFHPEGPLKAGLMGQPAPDAASAVQRARRLALSLDPCVPYNVRPRPDGPSLHEPTGQ